MAAKNGGDASHWVPLRGSARKPLRDANRVADADGDEPVTITVIVRRREALAAVMPRPLGTPATRTERVALRQRFAATHGAAPHDLETVAAYLRSAGLGGVEANAARRTVSGHGTVRQMNAAFRVDLGQFEARGVRHRGRVGHIHVPRHLDGVVEAVLGLDNRVQARPHHAHGGLIPGSQLPDPQADPRAALRSRECAALATFAVAAERTPARLASSLPDGIRLWPAQVGRLYDFPAHADGSGESIALIALGGELHDADISAYFRRAALPRPAISTVSAGRGDYAHDLPADAELMLDVAVTASIAPKADIVVYVAEQDDQGFFNAVSTAIHDTEHASSVMSISWGHPEESWTRQARAAFDAAFADAAALGVTVVCAAGDNGARDTAPDARVHVDFPAASPNVLACGGTMLVGRTHGAVKECVWNDGDGRASGGGVSRYRAAPPWQRDLRKRLTRKGSQRAGRGVPDIAGNASPLSGYVVRVHGRWRRMGGTSAVAPLYAGLCALLNQARGSAIGAPAPTLYGIRGARAGRVFRDVRNGHNSVPAVDDLGPVTGYRARKGWDACTGLGSLNGRELLAFLDTARDGDRERQRRHR